MTDELKDKSDRIAEAESSHRPLSVTDQIAERRALTLPSEDEAGQHGQIRFPPIPEDECLPEVEPLGKEDDLPHAPDKLEALHLTIKATPVGTGGEHAARFQLFCQEASQPNFHIKFPSMRAIGRRFGVAVSTIRSWYLSEEFHNALPEAVKRYARAHTPRVMEAVVLRAELTGDPAASKIIFEQAGMLDAKGEAIKGIDSTLRSMRDRAFQLQEESKKRLKEGSIEVEVVEE